MRLASKGRMRPDHCLRLNFLEKKLSECSGFIAVFQEQPQSRNEGNQSGWVSGDMNPMEIVELGWSCGAKGSHVFGPSI